MSDRSLASVLFALAGAPGWLAVSASMGGFSPPWLVGLTLAGAAASGAAGALAAPVLAGEAQHGASPWKGAVLGVFVSAFGVVLGAVAVVVVGAGLSVQMVTGFGFAFGALLLVMIPWFVFGAAAGAVFYALRRGGVGGAV